ncbi:MAG: hypothetical protein A2Y78_13565 [Acidobacteria bacterium RBG_13_68_16]|nr:MAG: hypothetical protein A2Y78_13565 [Acidobacteria bacterium RBG_13_68_16]
MDCPICREPLIVAERQSIELDVCPWCHGLWFDVGELELLAGKLGRSLELGETAFEPTATEEKARRCPRCDRAMDKVLVGVSGRLMLDRCAAHGFWFDHGELGALMRQLTPTPGSHPDAALAFMGEVIEAPAATAGAQPSTERRAGEVER